MTDQKKVVSILLSMANVMEEQKEFLTDLDNVIGDGDHGINMARGFAQVAAQASDLEQKDIGAILKAVGMTLVSKVGGSSGPLYGTAFMKAGMAIGAKTEIDMQDFLTGLEAGIEGVKARGKATTGEKTMLDSMVPALEAMKACSGDTKAVLAVGVAAAKEGVEATKPLIATKGRASYLGERSIGHQDPGATSFTFLLEEIAKAYN
jgi:dihydroxyacetone kinase-like protein